MALPPLRIALERGYDGGREGAWILDLPGAFGWARDRDQAISQAPSAAGWFRDWLARHDAPVDLAIGPVEVVEEVTVSVVGGYERNAILEADRVPVEPSELGIAIDRLGFARADLLELAGRIATLGAEDRAASGDGRHVRGALDVLRHIGDSETWLVSRLDPGARFGGVDRDGDVLPYLAATRVWFVDNLGRLHGRDPGLARTDGKGEAWTMRKVLRRAVYHSVDHLRELDRRVARSEGRVDRLEIRTERLADVAPLARLLTSVGWDRRLERPGQLQRAIDATRAMVGAWDGPELVGFARELGDGEFSAHISMVVVDPRWQGLGLASRLVSSIMEGRPDVRFTLGAAGGLDEYYGRFGFVPDDRAMVRRRR